MEDNITKTTTNKDDSSSVAERRLWLGNLDSRITEYQLLKLVQKHGVIEKFDLLFHRTGHLIGQPRGYAFVTYANKKDATVAKAALNNVLVGQRNIIVTWAHNVTNEELDKPKHEVNIPALAMSKGEKKTDRESQIQAIEAKLKLMDRKRREDELKINDTVSTKVPPVVVINQFQYNKQCPNIVTSSTSSSSSSSSGNNNLCLKSTNKSYHHHQEKYYKPYDKHKSRR